MLHKFSVVAALSIGGSLVVALPSGPAGAEATCGGKPATIEVTNDNIASRWRDSEENYIVDGTDGADVIVINVTDVPDDPVGGIYVHGKDGNDVVCSNVSDGTEGSGSHIDAGDGNDRIWTDDVASSIRGGAGHDKAYASRGVSFVGGPGNDLFQPGAVPGQQYRFSSGTGADKLDLSTHHGKHRIYLDQVRGYWGPVANRSTIRFSSLNKVAGSQGKDVLAGGSGADRLSGGPGDDRIVGRAGNDKLTGDDGTDTAEGGPGTDRCDAEVVTGC